MATDGTITCRLCGCRLREGEDLVRLDHDVLHLSCAAPALSGSPAWKAREVGTLNQLAEGMGRATVL